MDRYVAIGKASEALGVSITTLRRWEAEGKLIPERTAGRQRRYDLERQKQVLELYCAKQGWTFEVIADLG
ncbi:MAG: hypothetical protein DDT37_01836 [Firmicutes bacterium]|nr:hypothetical protein [candidate division NPL-UPA2 bacterium]